MRDTGASIPNRWWDLPSFLLIVVILTTAFTRLIVTKWAGDLDVTRMVSYIGLVLGLALGASRFSPRLVAFFSLAYGIIIIPWRLGLSLGEDISWIERLQSLSGRLGVIFTYLFQQRAVPDNLLFVLLMSILFWIISLHAGYTLIRYANPWVIVLPSGFAIILIQTYDALFASRIWYLVIYLFLALLLIARLVYLNQRRRWEQSRTYMPSYLGTDIIRFALVICILLVVLSWSTPALAKAIPAAKNSWERVVTPWWNDMRNVFENAFASLRSTVGLSGEYYGPNLSLGQGSLLSDAVIFTVQAPRTPPAGIRYYWRARVYDTFERSWGSSLQTTRALDAQDIDLEFPDLSDNPAVAYPFTFYLSKPIATILAPNQPVWLSRATRAELTFNPDGSADLGMLRATPSLRAGEIYSVRTSFNYAPIEKLRQAGTNYPDWVTARYLQLPATISQRTRQLAEEIAQGKETPFDVAEAVTQYLRANIDYTETVPALPSNQDLIDWFLFDLKQGFCNYYATAEIVLLRSLGIPARLAVGYASGDNVDNPEFYTVRQRDAHAWPEVYFPGIGWVEFEPTASQPTIIRPQLITANEEERDFTDLGENLNLSEPEPPLDRRTTNDLLDDNIVWRRRLSLILSIGLIVVLIALAIPLIRRRQLHKKVPLFPIFLERAMRRAGLKPPRFLQSLALLAALSPLERAYQQINLALARVGRLPSPTYTPAERTEALSERLPTTRAPANVVLTEYHRAVYSPRGASDEQAAIQAGDDIRSISIRAMLRRRFGL